MTATSACHLLFIGPFKNYPQITVYHPKDQGHPFANIGWTGWIGSITGMYAHIRTVYAYCIQHGVQCYVRARVFIISEIIAFLGTRLLIMFHLETIIMHCIVQHVYMCAYVQYCCKCIHWNQAQYLGMRLQLRLIPKPSNTVSIGKQMANLFESLHGTDHQQIQKLAATIELQVSHRRRWPSQRLG